MYEDERDNSYGSTKKAAPEDARKAYVKWTAKESKDLPAQFRRPDYVSSPGASTEQDLQVPQAREEASEEAKPAEKKKEQYEL